MPKTTQMLNTFNNQCISNSFLEVELAHSLVTSKGHCSLKTRKTELLKYVYPIRHYVSCLPFDLNFHFNQGYQFISFCLESRFHNFKMFKMQKSCFDSFLFFGI